MKRGFIFEKDLPHQVKAVESIIKVFSNLPIKIDESFDATLINPIIINKSDNHLTYEKNIKKLQEENNVNLENKPTFSNIIDIMMETGTGKTYTYTKAIFELNKHYGIFKFIIIVPTLSIKAGTENFIKSDSAREHFKEQYNKTITLHVVESQKRNKSKKSYIPSSISEFVRADKNDTNTIHVLLINAGMLNSDTMQKNFDRTLFDKYTKPIEALANTNPIVIMDEPHKFSQENKTWQNIQSLNPQYTIRFGATFPEKEKIVKNELGKKEKKKIKAYENLIYILTAVDSFNQNLVKGVITYIEEFKQGQNIFVHLVNTNGNEATFGLVDNSKKSKLKLSKKEELIKIHPNLKGLFIENLNKTEVLLSNGLVLKKGNKINPFSYAETLQESMIKKAVENHFKIERELLKQSPRIKPLTLFFIDNIDEYRNKSGYLYKTISETVKAIAEKYLKEEDDEFYRKYLEKTITNIELTHGGYFSQDNIVNDEQIEKEIHEILHDKESLLDINNPRRFIFSKWTLKEGWDNPNVFQICKLRSSGSEISKLQEVGRGLRLPVNEYMSRVKDRQFYLNYYVDFTENDFAEKLRNEVNEKSHAISREIIPEKLTDSIIKRLLETYSDKFKNENELLESLDDDNVIRRDNSFKDGGFDYIKKNFPLIFDGVALDKIKKSTEEKKKVKVRAGKYNELKELWEELNKKAILEYNIESENKFKELFREFIKTITSKLKEKTLISKKVEIKIEEGKAISNEEYLLDGTEFIPIITMGYHKFLIELSKTLKANPKTLHDVFTELSEDFEVNNFLNTTTIRTLKTGFDNFLFSKSIDKFGISYNQISHTVHPTKLTNKKGEPLDEINASDIGMIYSEESVANSYYFEELFYDSQLEKENIITNIDEVVVFTKIPKNSIKIPVAGGGTYSPDFAYIIKTKNSEKKLYFVVETKDVSSEDSLREKEIKKIKHAELFFGNKVKFETQFSDKKMVELINEIFTKET
ncbi:MAG: type restriction enzyme [Deferribacteres bacterium]|jgi:type III restriction enzyme|nr:type restriction enzyme [Deferribacteres bacterium]